MNCLLMSVLLTLGHDQCAANHQDLVYVGFNKTKSTFIVQCSTTNFNMLNALPDKYNCVKLDQ